MMIKLSLVPSTAQITKYGDAAFIHSPLYNATIVCYTSCEGMLKEVMASCLAQDKELYSFFCSDTGWESPSGKIYVCSKIEKWKDND